MRKLLLILPLLLMTSCGTFAALSDGISKSRELLVNLNETYQELKPSIDTAVATTKDLIADGKQLYDQSAEIAGEFKTMSAAAKQKADTDGDGKLDWMEHLAYLLALGGGAAEIARRKMKGTQTSIDRLHARVDNERAKRKANEAAAAS